MKIQTFSVVVGTSACNAGCRFCVSHTTGFEQLPKEPKINEINFRKAVKLATMSGCTTLLFTGKGEPTLYPETITQYLTLLKDMGDPFPFIEIQTNAIEIGQWYSDQSIKASTLRDHFEQWHKLGLNTIGISTTGIRNDWNKSTYLHHRNIEYPDLRKTINGLHDLGFSVRVCVMMQQGMVDSKNEVRDTINWCKENRIEQLTLRPIRKPVLPVMGSDPFVNWINKYGLSPNQETDIREYVDTVGTKLMTLMQGSNHKAIVYDVVGQNVCMSDCLTLDSQTDDIRTLIFFGDGKLVYDWSYEGARLL